MSTTKRTDPGYTEKKPLGPEQIVVQGDIYEINMPTERTAIEIPVFIIPEGYEFPGGDFVVRLPDERTLMGPFKDEMERAERELEAAAGDDDEAADEPREEVIDLE